MQGTVQTELVGGYNLPNVLAAASVGKFFSVPEEKIIQALEQYKPSNSRSQLVKKGSNTIIVDAYNANPSSMKLAVENFAKASGDNKILVLGAMAELGHDSLQEHQAIINEIRKHQWKNVLLVGGDFLKLDHPFQKAPSSIEAGQWLQKQKLNQAVLLVKGSRSAQMEKVLEYI
jgi:UDP-N-acetylmuramoyl-tripeptide--D-alanyl-D-alanine ligase